MFFIERMIKVDNGRHKNDLNRVYLISVSEAIYLSI